MYFLRTTALVLLAFFISDALGQNSTTAVMPTPTPSSTVAPMSSQVLQSTQSVTIVTIPTEGTTQKGETTPTTMKQTCAKIKFVVEQKWNASLKISDSEKFKEWKNMTFMEMKYLYNDYEKYYDVNLSEVAFSNKDGKVGVEAKLCMVVKGKESGFIETVFTDKVKSGQLHNLKVVSGSAEFTPEGVEFKDWKAKDGECDTCSGAGGEFTIERQCVSKEHSCDGLKEEKKTQDCVEYCHGGTAGIAVSLVVLAFGMLLSFSSQ